MKFTATHTLTNEFGTVKEVEVTKDGLIFDEYERQFHFGCEYNLINGKVYRVTSTRKFEVKATLSKI